MIGVVERVQDESMFDSQAGTRLRFFRTVKSGRTVIPGGTRVKVESVHEPDVTVTTLEEPHQAITVPRYVVELNCVPA